MIPNEKNEMVQTRLQMMSEDAKRLQSLVKQRQDLVKAVEDKLAKENKERQASLVKIRESHSSLRTARNEAKEKERRKVSRTLMANLCNAADYPDAPPYVPHMINVMQNILSKYCF